LPQGLSGNGACQAKPSQAKLRGFAAARQAIGHLHGAPRCVHTQAAVLRRSTVCFVATRCTVHVGVIGHLRAALCPARMPSPNETCSRRRSAFPHRRHICTETGLTRATSAPGLGPAPATSAPGRAVTATRTSPLWRRQALARQASSAERQRYMLHVAGSHVPSTRCGTTMSARRRILLRRCSICGRIM
jgi:hypothetical protein